MKVLDPGHLYELAHLDAGGRGFTCEKLRFVKRIGAKYPGNEPPGYAGTTSQEVLRALEHRAAVVRGDIDEFSRVMNSGPNLLIEDIPTCDRCGHIACTRTAEQHD